VSDVGILILTAALVGLNAYYAVQTRRTVEEMQAQRHAALLPRLALGLFAAGPEHVFIEIRNVGPGAALDVDLALRLIKHDGDVETRRWPMSLMAPNDHEQVMYTPPGGDRLLKTDALAARFVRFEITGTMKDAADHEYPIAHQIDDLTAAIAARRNAYLRWEHPDAEHRLAKELGEHVAKPIAKAVDQMAKATQRRAGS
jgi:hypothetical protein